MLEMTALRTCSKSFTPLVNRRVKNDLNKYASDLNHPLFQLINAVDLLSSKPVPA